MIKNKKDFYEYRNKDMAFYLEEGISNKKKTFFLRLPAYYIAKYLLYLRKEEYYVNTAGKNPIKKFLAIYYQRKKNVLGCKLDIYIPRNVFGPGLIINHLGGIIVNGSAKIGANCRLHGGNCIGNNGKDSKAAVIGDNFDLGVGAKVIGEVVLGNNVVIGANAVVTKSFDEDNIVLVGIPAKKLAK